MPTSLPSAVTVTDNLPSRAPTRGAELVTADGRSLPLVGAKLRAEAQGGIARLVLEQRFENRHAETLNVTYRMPLPADGAVSGYAFDIAGRTIVGQIDRKHRARERFEEAVASGHTAGLLEQERADIFTQRLGNLPANETLVARITIDQKLIWLPEGEWELRFPTVIGPRYVTTAEDARATGVATKLDGVSARIQIEVAIGDAITTGRMPSSPSHALEARAEKATLVVALRDTAGAQLDRDIVVRWPVAGADVGLGLAHARPLHGDDMFGLLTVVPPTRGAGKAVVRDLIVLIDTSGSMSGGPLDKAKQVIALLVESLGEADRLELIEFSSHPRRYKSDPVAATREEKQRALKWLRGLSAGGGTEMRSAVIEAMRALRPGSQRQVVLATDGYIGGEQQIVQQLNSDLPKSCRLHFVGVGSSVNRTLSTSLARAGRGAEVLCDLDEDAERATQRLIDKTRMPVLTDVTLAGSAIVATAPELVPDVFEGSPLVAAVKLRAGEIVVRGTTATGPWEQRLVVHAKRAGEGNQAFAALYGREHVADLEARAFAGESNDAEIERTGLVFQISTRLTSWIAVDEARVTRGPTRDEVMPQALPYGTTAAAFGLRAPAAMGFADGDAMFGTEEVTGQAMAFSELADAPAEQLADKSVGRQRRVTPAMPAQTVSKTIMLGAPGGGAPVADDDDEVDFDDSSAIQPQFRRLEREVQEAPEAKAPADKPVVAKPRPKRAEAMLRRDDAKPVAPRPASKRSPAITLVAALAVILAIIAALIWWLAR